MNPTPTNKHLEEKDEVVIRLCGDSGDGMQITGNRFTETSAVLGNDLATFPDYPAEIRAPAGSLFGVSGFQIHFSSKEIRTAGDAPDVLVAMNPAALKTNLKDLKKKGMLILNLNAFTEDNLKLANYSSNPLEDGSLNDYELYKVPMTLLTEEALKDSGLTKKDMARCKNFFALGLMYWLYQRPLDITLDWIDKKFKSKPEIVDANKKVLKSGYYFGETTEIFKCCYKVSKAKLTPGTYRNITGNEATALGFIAASQLANKPLIYCSYPITPASDILHELSRHKNFDIKTCQAEDEIAAMGMALGVAFAGGLGLTGTSGPGLALKSEALSLAIMMELPLVVINVQRGGPSTGLPTKTEQADLFQALYGRHGEAPLAVIAPATPAECFSLAIEAVRLSIQYMTPVIFLSDGYLANGAEPWNIPPLASLNPIVIKHPTQADKFQPYLREPETLASPWAIPGTPGLEHRIGGIEKQDITGNISYDPVNHEHMVHLRAEKIGRIAQSIPLAQVFGKESGDVLVIGWGGTFGAITTAVETLQREGLSISSLHLRFLNPFPANLGDVLSRFKKIIVAELNTGQLAQVLRGQFTVDIKSLTKIQGRPFNVKEVVDGIRTILNEGNNQWKLKKAVSN
ncbi:MAG TPA: 2-oxoglutarate ferredoxin oxidoreductase subunit alpha [Deltaproteobacteria bacterium]|nr:2-oxoglutarate ferredoxin oxidoreductase subunit alpha [Deltaproteobacteria bacterium]